MASKKPLSIGSFVQDFPVTDHKWRVLIFKVSFNWREVFSLAYRADVCCKTLKGFLICVLMLSGPQGWQVPNPQWHTWCFTTKLCCTASTDRRCEYLNGYVTVQHHSFGKPSFLDPQSSIVETRDSTLVCRDSILASRNSKRLSFETWGSSIEFRASSVNLHLSGTVEKTSHSLMCECFPNGCGSL